MGKNSRKIFSIIFILTIFFDVVVFAKKTFSKNKEDLININELSEDFMDNYFEEVSNVKEEDKENMLIITSKDELKDTYGASKVIEAPNHQYFLQYGSEEEKNNALEKFNSDNSDIDVSENDVYELFEEDTVLVSSYNSWGVEAMGIDTLLQKLENKELNDVVVAIIDSGVDVDLFNKYYPGRLIDGFNILNNSYDIHDVYGHGTHIAGTIAESTSANVKILPIKVCDIAEFFKTDIITAVNYITYNENADVINMSFGGKQYSKEEFIAIEAAKQKNIISVAAAGNDSLPNDIYPSSHSNTISVAAVDSNKEKTSFSNYGHQIMFAAPGDGIKSIMGKDTSISQLHEEDYGSDGDDDHEISSGTSMATPHVVAAIANLKSLNKNLKYEDIVIILRRYSEDLGDAGWDEYYGYGFINFSGAQICDGSDCDEYGIFKRNENYNIEDILESYEIHPILTSYDYGTITNILSTQVIVRYTNGKTDQYRLGELNELDISEYNPYSKNKQIINIKLKTPLGIEIVDSFEITNPETYETVWEYQLVENNKIEIVNCKDSVFEGGVIYFPSTIDGHIVTGIADRESSMFEANWEAFKNVKKVYLPATLTKIGNNAFGSKNDLRYNENGLTYVKSDAESITVGDNAFMGSVHLFDLDANVSYVGNNAFYGALALRSINFADGITHIGTSAFKDSMYNSSIIIPSSVVELGESMFQNDSVRNVVFLNDMDTIPDNMFSNNWNLKSVTLPEGVRKIGDNAFIHCLGLTSINLQEGLTIIGNKAFEGAFKYNGNMTITIPKSVTTIGEDAFKEIDSTAKLYVYSDSVAKSYAHTNNVNYVQIDPDTIDVHGINSQYNAFDTVDMNSVSLELTYNEETTRTETITENIEIEYHDSRENLRYGDTSIKLVAYNEAGYKIEENVPIEVLKLQPEYSVPTGLSATAGQKLSQIELPEGFEWVSGNQTVSGSGDVVYKARFVPSDTKNYETVENIDIAITVRPYVVNNYTVDENNDIISNITPNTELNSFTSNIILGYGYGIDADSKEVNGKQVLYTGAKVRITHGLDLYKEYTVSVKGDINGDGDISVSDISMIYKNLKRKNEFSSAQSIASDVNGDEGVSVSDISVLYKVLKRKINL